MMALLRLDTTRTIGEILTVHGVDAFRDAYRVMGFKAI
jgi:hypothetical protein